MSGEPGITFVGAAGTVTGSKTLVESRDGTALVDYGMYQGVKDVRAQNRRPFPYPVRDVDGLALTHAHIDHSGLLPLLAKEGFSGPINATAATAELLHVLLPDAAELQVEDARYANKKGFSKHDPALPLFTPDDAEAALRLVRPVPRDRPVAVAPGVDAAFRQAGHILGSAWLDLSVATAAGSVRLVMSGDLGRAGSPILPPADAVDGADVMVIESTYGDRDHPADRAADVIRRIITDVVARRSVLLVPAFAVDRTEDLLFLIHELEAANEIPAIPVWVDSPMAKDAFRSYLGHPEELAAPLAEAVRAGRNPFAAAGLRFTRSVEESKALNGLAGPAIVISASGMATGGRILHHLKRRLPDPQTTVLFCGHQAQGTRGRALVEGARSVKIHGEQVPVRARVMQLDMLSSHADRGDMLAWLSGVSSPPAMVFPVHGETGPQAALADLVRRELGWQTTIATPGLSVPFASLGRG